MCAKALELFQQIALEYTAAEGKKEILNYTGTAAYAFGTAGDVMLAKNERYVGHWRKLEKPEEERQFVPHVQMR